MKCYGIIKLTNTSPQQSFDEPLTLSEVKTFLELPERSPVDTAEDALLDAMIRAARKQAEIMQNRWLVVQQLDFTLDYFPACEIRLPTPLVSVDLVQYRDSDGTTHNLTKGTDYIVDLARGLILPAYGTSWPSFASWPSSAVLIQLTAGYDSSDVYWSDAGSGVLIGIRELITHWYSHRLPFDTLQGNVLEEFPYAVTVLLSSGANPRQIVA